MKNVIIFALLFVAVLSVMTQVAVAGGASQAAGAAGGAAQMGAQAAGGAAQMGAQAAGQMAASGMSAMKGAGMAAAGAIPSGK